MKTLKNATQKELTNTIQDLVEQIAEFYHLSEKDAVTVLNKTLRSNCINESIFEQTDFIMECEKEEVRL